MQPPAIQAALDNLVETVRTSLMAEFLELLREGKPAAVTRTAVTLLAIASFFSLNVIEVLAWIAREQMDMAVAKQVRQLEIDGAHRAMKVDIAKQFRFHR